MPSDPDITREQAAASLVVGVVLLAFALAAVAARDLVDNLPSTLEQVNRRLRKAVRLHRVTMLLAAVGGLLCVSAVAASAVFVVTAFALAVGVFLKTAARTRKVATAFYLAAGDLLEAPATPDAAKRRAVLDKCYVAGSSGIDTGLLRHWWAHPVLHDGVLEGLVATTSGQPLSDEVIQQLRWTRRALQLQLDVGA